ncbi:hypothetical protein BDV40DRAFT_298225 [Aspergillus tamarii]|uniref:Uncharacterized protein n=1 Tax=Aspergillus tamarii TaxID=41984 RepID=A0A5N6V207_ASPTM|nr:hypothetical protein BDV40DRAFT_298225 [Aspergillus tamarii]
MNSTHDYYRPYPGYPPAAQSEYQTFPSTPQNWTPPSRIQLPSPSSERQPSTEPDSRTITPAPKTQPTEPTKYADLLRLYLTIKKDVSSKFTLPNQEETTASWVFQALMLLDHAECVAEAHLAFVESLEREIRALRDLLDRMRDAAPFESAVASVKNLMEDNRHDEEGVKIVQERVEALDRFSTDMAVLW